MGIFTWLDRVAGDSRHGKDWQKLHDFGRDKVIPYGDTLTKEGLSGLRKLDSTYEDRLKDPLGATGRGIFARARGNLSDDFARTVNAGMARREQLARQTGGGLTPEQIAALDAQERREANEGLFRGENDLAMGEAGMTLEETGKLFDRMEGIRRTVIGVGQDEKTRGLQTMIAALTGRTGRVKAIADTFSNIYGSSKGG